MISRVVIPIISNYLLDTILAAFVPTLELNQITSLGTISNVMLKGALGGISSVVMQAVKIGLGAFMGKLLKRIIGMTGSSLSVPLGSTTLSLSMGWQLVESKGSIGPFPIKEYTIIPMIENAVGLLSSLSEPFDEFFSEQGHAPQHFIGKLGKSHFYTFSVKFFLRTSLE